ncbi:MAG: PQQ-dependent sugar dehydrogenase [Dehalococcoidia bacterium]|nr:PQQ-dependent sugar dehydrogenase [Dehalococcoidia bacterium]
MKVATLVRWLALALLAAGIALTGTRTGGEPALAPLGPSVVLRWGYNILRVTGETDPPPAFNPLPTGYRIETVVEGLDRPAALAATPDGRLLVAEQAGAVRVVQDGRLLDEPFVSVDARFVEVELGLVGIAVDSEFVQNGFVYLLYPAKDPDRTVVARVRDEGGRGVDLEEIFTVDFPAIQHVGGALRSAPDGTLFVGIGDHERVNDAQEPTSPVGRILRLNRDGSFPLDNPFIGATYAYGLRNPFGIALDPKSGRVYASENGFLGQDAVIEVKPGAFYGWPGPGFLLPGEGIRASADLRMPDETEEVEDPLLFFHSSLGMGGMEFYSSDVLSEFTGHLFFCQVNNGGALHEIEFAPDGAVKREAIRATGCTTGVTTGADGFLYFLNYAEGVLYRIASDAGSGP